MRNLFDDNIKQTFEENLGDIHASDELKSKLLARLNSEAVETPRNKVALTAISPDYVYNNQRPQRRKKSNIVWLTAALASAIVILISSSLINFFGKHNEVEFEPAADTQPSSSVLIEGNTSALIAQERGAVNYPVKELERIDYEEIQRARMQNAKDDYLSYNSRARRV